MWTSFKNERIQTRICCTTTINERKNSLESKRKHYIQESPKQGYIAKVVRSFYKNPKDVFPDSQEMKNACKVAKCCYEKWESGDLDDDVSEKKFCSLGGGWKALPGEVLDEFFQWFKAFCFLIYFIVYFKISELILKENSSAP